MKNQLRVPLLLAALAYGCATFCAAAADSRPQGQPAAPPDVVIMSPKESDSEVEQEELTVRVSLLSYGIPLTEVLVTLNGEKVSSKTYAEPLGRDRLEFAVKLRPGVNVLSVTASNRIGASRPVVRRVTYAPREESDAPSLYVLSIGVGKYGSPKMSLPFARSDALKVDEAFQGLRGRSPFRNILTRVILDEGATREAILDGLLWLNKAARGARDVRVVFIAGLTAEVDGTDYLLSPLGDSPAGSPASDLRLGLIWEALSSAPGAAVVFGDLAMRDLRSPAAQSASAGPAQRRRYLWGDNVNSFIAAADDETPRDDPASRRSSAFTTALLEGLSGKADPGGCIELDDLSDWLDKSVSRLTRNRQGVFALVLRKYKSTRLTCS